jgi:hypothetical protein
MVFGHYCAVPSMRMYMCNMCKYPLKIYNGIFHTAIILKETKETLLCQHLFLLAAGGNAILFDPFLGPSSGIQEHWY